jgi:hypothetical protein
MKYQIYNILVRNIYNQSYINLNNKFKKELLLKKDCQILIKNLNKKINFLENNNKKLIEKNKQLEEELLLKNRFYNINHHKLY